MKKGILIHSILFTILLTTISSAWTPVKRLTWNSGNSEWPVIAARGPNDKIHIFWADNSSGDFEIYMKSSTDTGSTWSAPHRLTWTSGYSRYPCAKSDSTGNIFLAWIEESPGNKEIYFKKSSNDGTNWSGAKRMTWTSGSSSYPFIIIDNNYHVYLLWQERISLENEEIFFKKSTDAGSTWSLTQRLTWSSRDSRSVCAAVDTNNTIHVVWHDWTSAYFQIFHKKSLNGGTTWSSTNRLTWTSCSCMDPYIGIDSNNNIYVVWLEILANDEIFFKRSTDGGTNWGALTRLTWNPGRSMQQRLIINSYNVLYVVWADDSPLNYEIFHKWSADGGLNWSGLSRLSWNSGSSFSPYIIPDKKNNPHLVWSDNTPGNYEIHYKVDIGGTILKNR